MVVVCKSLEKTLAIAPPCDVIVAGWVVIVVMKMEDESDHG